MSKLTLPVVITPSRVELGARCHRRHSLADVAQYGKYFSPAACFGTVIHAGTGEWWKTGDIRKVYSRLNAEWDAQFNGGKNVSQEKVSLKLAQAMLDGYVTMATLAGPFTNQGDWQVVTLEDRLEVPLGEHVLRFQQDRALYNKEQDWLVIVDTKSAGRLDKRWRSGWEMSLQMKLYKAASLKAYEVSKVDVVVEGVLKEPSTEIEYVICPEWGSRMLNEAWQTAIGIADRDRALLEFALENDLDPLGVLVRNPDHNPQDCFSYGMECQYKELCVAEPNERLPILMAEYFPVETEEY